MTRWQDRHKVVPSVYIVLERESQVLLLRRANTGYRDGFYSLPAGHLDGGESAIQAAIRECAEEVGVTVTPAQLQLVHVMHRLAEDGDHERIDFYFKATEWKDRPRNAEPNKCDGVRWASYADLPGDMIPEVRAALEGIAGGNMYTDVGF